MLIKLIAFKTLNTLKNLIKNTGFSLRLSKFDFNGSGPVKKYLLGGLLYVWYVFKKILNKIKGRFELDYVEIFITSRCTLNCRDCSILIPHLGKLNDFDIDKAINDLKTFLGCVDYIHKLGILGGEAMLHKDFIRILEFAAGNEKIGSIRIVTNGTFIPGESILKALQSTQKVYVNISRYPVVPINAIQKLKKALEKYSIKYTIYEYLVWSDLGSPGMKREKNQEILKKRFNRCWMKNCLGILDGRFHMCGRSAFLPLVAKTEGVESDYINLRNIDDSNEGREAIKAFLKKKSISACAYCNGTFDSLKIQPAIQVDKHMNIL